MKVVFWGTPAGAARYLPLIDRSHQLVGVVTQPDRPRGRGRKLQPSPVKVAAQELEVPVFQPESVGSSQFIEQLAQLEADTFVVVAYGRILPEQVIQMPAKAAINVHYSLLPKLRGAAPVQHALLQGLTTTGVTVQYISRELDTGDIIAQGSLAIHQQDNAVTLTERLTELGIELLAEALSLIEAGNAPRICQDHDQATLAPALSKEDGIIDWCQPAQSIVNQVQACWPWPGAVCQVQGRRIRISQAIIVDAEDRQEGNCGIIAKILPNQGWVVTAGQDAVLVVEVQPEGRRVMSAPDYLRGAHLQQGEKMQ